jgi:uncharacterized protein YycO
MINLFVVLVVVASLLSVIPVQAGGQAPSVSAEIATIKSLPANQQGAEIQNYVAKLPISAQSRALQARAQKLSMSLATANPAQTQAILQELTKISAQLQQDPAIAQVQNDLLNLSGNSLNPAVTTPPAFSSLVKGDILARNSGASTPYPWTMVYQHDGTYYGNSQVFESNSDGVRLKPLSSWQTKGVMVGLARDNKVSASVISAAVDWAVAKYGTNGKTPYNYIFWNKTTDAKLYCSQLTWKINGHAGVDVDSNSVQYETWAAAKFGAWIVNAIIVPAVAPDEVMLSPNVTVYNTGVN